MDLMLQFRDISDLNCLNYYRSERLSEAIWIEIALMDYQSKVAPKVLFVYFRQLHPEMPPGFESLWKEIAIGNFRHLVKMGNHCTSAVATKLQTKTVHTVLQSNVLWFITYLVFTFEIFLCYENDDQIPFGWRPDLLFRLCLKWMIYFNLSANSS